MQWSCLQGYKHKKAAKHFTPQTLFTNLKMLTLHRHYQHCSYWLELRPCWNHCFLPLRLWSSSTVLLNVHSAVTKLLINSTTNSASQIKFWVHRSTISATTWFLWHPFLAVFASQPFRKIKAIYTSYVFLTAWYSTLLKDASSPQNAFWRKHSIRGLLQMSSRRLFSRRIVEANSSSVLKAVRLVWNVRRSDSCFEFRLNCNKQHERRWV